MYSKSHYDLISVGIVPGEIVPVGVERENLRNSRRLRKNDGHCRRGTLARWEVESPGAKTSCHAGMDIVSGEWKVSSDDKVGCSVPELEQSTVDG